MDNEQEMPVLHADGVTDDTPALRAMVEGRCVKYLGGDASSLAGRIVLIDGSVLIPPYVNSHEVLGALAGCQMKFGPHGMLLDMGGRFFFHGDPFEGKDEERRKFLSRADQPRSLHSAWWEQVGFERESVFDGGEDEWPEELISGSEN